MDDEELYQSLAKEDAYSVVRLLAEGPAGRTELVQDAAGTQLVRKRVREELVNERAWRELRELDSPLLPHVRDMYRLPGAVVVVTTYVEGITMAEFVKAAGSLGAGECVRYLADLCEAASVLHAHGIVHRDISPSNVVVSGGRARLIDLGNVRVYEEGARHDTTRLGTWGFAAPEQFGFAQSDARSDIYGLGSLLGYMLCGVLPSDEGFDDALADPTRVSSEMRTVVLKARAFEPSARYQRVEELARAAREAAQRSVAMEPTAPRAVETYEAAHAPASYDANKAGVARADQYRNVRQQAAYAGAAPQGTGRQAGQAQATYGRAAQAQYAQVTAVPVENAYETKELQWRDLGFFTRAKCVAIILFIALVGIAYLKKGFDSSFYTHSYDVMYYPLTTIILAACCVGVARETYCYYVRRGRYAGPKPLKQIWKSVGKWILVFILCGIIAMEISIAFLGGSS